MLTVTELISIIFCCISVILTICNTVMFFKHILNNNDHGHDQEISCGCCKVENENDGEFCDHCGQK